MVPLETMPDPEVPDVVPIETPPPAPPDTQSRMFVPQGVQLVSGVQEYPRDHAQPGQPVYQEASFAGWPAPSEPMPFVVPPVYIEPQELQTPFPSGAPGAGPVRY